MAKFEDVLERVRDLDEDLATELEEFKGSSLRKKAEERDSFETRVKELEAEVAKRDEAPKRQQAFEKYGIDFDALRPAEKRLLDVYDGELTDEAIAELVEENELPITESDTGEDDQDRSDADRIVENARRPNQGSRVPKLTPEIVADWPIDRWVRFADANPDAAEVLRRGESVIGVTG